MAARVPIAIPIKMLRPRCFDLHRHKSNASPRFGRCDGRGRPSLRRIRIRVPHPCPSALRREETSSKLEARGSLLPVRWLLGFVADLPDFAEQLTYIHSRERLK